MPANKGAVAEVSKATCIGKALYVHNFQLTLHQPYHSGDKSLACILFKHTLDKWVPSPQTGPSHPNYVGKSNHTHSLTSVRSGCLGNADSF